MVLVSIDAILAEKKGLLYVHERLLQFQCEIYTVYMKFVLLFPDYLKWHYGSAFLDIWNIERNIFWFLFNFFSFNTLLKTLFSPFMRLRESYRGGILHPSDFFDSLVVNTLMRIVGICVRLIVIIAGCCVLIVAGFIGVLFFVAWILAPVIIIGLFVAGVSLLF